MVVLESGKRIAIPGGNYNVFTHIESGDTIRKSSGERVGYVLKTDTVLVIQYVF